MNEIVVFKYRYDSFVDEQELVTATGATSCANKANVVLFALVGHWYHE